MPLRFIYYYSALIGMALYFMLYGLRLLEMARPLWPCVLWEMARPLWPTFIGDGSAFMALRVIGNGLAFMACVLLRWLGLVMALRFIYVGRHCYGLAF